MYIANPIYDSVFKYLMDDNKVARLLLSAIIGEEIVKLTYTSTNVETKLAPTLTVLQIDFAATIRSADGAKRLIIIEIQKARYAPDIMRFRRYLGEQYANEKNVLMLSEPEIKYGKALPILSVYFLGYKLDKIKAPVIKVQREYYDLTSGRIIKDKEEFIESLTHDSFVIQIPYLKQKRKNELLQVLSIFDQSNREKDYHILNVKEEEFPKKYRLIIRRLQKAQADPVMKNAFEREDMHREYLAGKDRSIAEKDKSIAEKDKVLAEKDKALREKDKAIAELKKQLSNRH